MCPYPGLASFNEADAEIFFGRESMSAHLVKRLASRLSGTSVLVVAGPSGAGKSSLLRAGLLPAIDRVALVR
jgi:ABC-type transport system involved in cytochrome c biogenesis ATPase subunit